MNVLEQRGIASSTTPEDYGEDGTVVVLSVDESCCEDAVRLLSDPVIGDTIKCPDCGGIHIAYPNQPEASPTAALAEKIAETLHLTDRTFFCHACQYEWGSVTEPAAR